MSDQPTPHPAPIPHRNPSDEPALPLYHPLDHDPTTVSLPVALWRYWRARRALRRLERQRLREPF